MPGETANVSSVQELSLDVLCNRAFNKIQVIADGELVKTINAGEVTRYINTLSIPELKGKKWAIVYVEGGGNYQFAFTNPIYFTEAALEPVSVIPSAFVKKLNGNKNDLTVTVTETFPDGSINMITKTISISNNAAGVYEVGSYKVYVDTKGNDQIRQCYIM